MCPHVKHCFLAIISLLSLCIFEFVDNNIISYEPLVYCDDDYEPDHCGTLNVSLSAMANVEDFDRCGPAALPKTERNYFWAGSGRKVTYMANFADFKKLKIVPKYLRNLTPNTITTTVLGHQIRFPVGLSPVAAQALAHPNGEVATARAAVSRLGTVMILSSMASFGIEEVADAVWKYNPVSRPVLWMQTYIQKDRQNVLQLLKRAEANGFSAIVVTLDIPVSATIACDSRTALLARKIKFPNLMNETFDSENLNPSATFRDLSWIKRSTILPVVAKGILTGADALSAVRAGVDAILVSNHGGRQLDGVLSTIEALPAVVKALKRYPNVEVYLDGGVRNGYDVFKALSQGARAVFVGRPIVWGLAIAGEEGVHKMLTVLKTEFNETMLLAGARNPQDIGPGFTMRKDDPNFSLNQWLGLESVQ